MKRLKKNTRVGVKEPLPVEDAYFSTAETLRTLTDLRERVDSLEKTFSLVRAVYGHGKPIIQTGGQMFEIGNGRDGTVMGRKGKGEPIYGPLESAQKPTAEALEAFLNSDGTLKSFTLELKKMRGDF